MSLAGGKRPEGWLAGLFEEGLPAMEEGGPRCECCTQPRPAALPAAAAAGRVSAARRLCEEVGQPWRAASLGGGGAQGPVPLAAAADEADEPEAAWEQPEDMAAEVGAARAAGPACLSLATHGIQEALPLLVRALALRCRRWDSLFGPRHSP